MQQMGINKYNLKPKSLKTKVISYYFNHQIKKPRNCENNNSKQNLTFQQVIMHNFDPCFTKTRMFCNMKTMPVLTVQCITL